MSSIFRITEPITINEDIEKYKHFACQPVVETNLNNSGGAIRIYIENKDIFTHLSESFLLVEGRLTKGNGGDYGADDHVSLANNSMMYLFKDMRYELSGQEMEKIANLGQATTMLGLLKYPDDFSKSKGLNQCWYKDTLRTAETQNVGWNLRRLYIIKHPDPKGSFGFKIPLKHIFGFCNDYDKVVHGFKHALILTRNDDHDAIFRAGAVDPGKITLSKVSWFMPDVVPDLETKKNLLGIIGRKEKLAVGYRMIQCTSAAIPRTTSFSWRLSVKSSPEVLRFIIVRFQTERTGEQDRNPSIFNHCNIRNIYAMLNNRNYPEYHYNLSFPKYQFSRAYGDAAEFGTKFFNMDELI